MGIPSILRVFQKQQYDIVTKYTKDLNVEWRAYKGCVMAGAVAVGGRVFTFERSLMTLARACVE